MDDLLPVQLFLDGFEKAYRFLLPMVIQQ